MRIFVTGASGFIGSELCRQAVAAQHEVLRLEKPSRLNDLPLDLISSFKPEVAVHCAWIATPDIYADSLENEVLRSQSIELFRALSFHGLKHFIGCGTCAEYAPSPFVLDEDHSTLAPSSRYARAKHEFHGDLSSAALELSVRLTWARIFFPYGHGEHPNRLISTLFRSFQEGRRENLRSRGAVRDYIHVEDVASALLLFATSHATGCFNIGTGEGVTVGEVEAEVARLCSRSELVEAAPRFVARSSDDSFVASNRKLRALGWTPRYKLSEGLATYRKQPAN